MATINAENADVQRTIPEQKEPDVRTYRARRLFKMWEQTRFLDHRPIIRPAPSYKNVAMLYVGSVGRSDNIRQALAGSTATKLVTEDLPNPDVGLWTHGDPNPRVHNSNVHYDDVGDDRWNHKRFVDRSSDKPGITVQK